MKLISTNLTLALALAWMTTGCGDSSQTTSTPPETSKPAAAQPASPVAATGQEAAKAAQQAAGQAVDAAKGAADGAAAKVSEAIAGAQKLFAEGKLQEAKDSLAALASSPLTADQQKLVTDLKAKIDQAMAAAKAASGGAAKALQGVLPK